MNFIQKFKDYLLALKPAPSKITVKNYCIDVKHFITWIEATTNQPFNPKGITLEKIEQFHHDEQTHLSLRSLERHISSLRKFFQALKLQGIITENPFDAGKKQVNQEIDPFQLKRFKDFLYVYNASNLTIKNYIIDVKQFLTWAKEVTKNEEVDQESLLSRIDDAFVASYRDRLLAEKVFSPASINRKLSSLRKYLTWAGSQHLINVKEGFPNNLNSIKNITSTKNLPLPETSIFEAKFPLEEQKKAIISYSSFPPIRLVQKLTRGILILFDILFIFPLALLGRMIQKAVWFAKGKPLFVKNSLVSPVKKDLHVRNLSKSLFAPFKISLTNLTWYEKLLFHTKNTRPNWYKRYHSYAITTYFHWAILIIFTTAIGFGFYNNFVSKPKNAQPALAAAPPRILSFQGRLTDANNNPITTSTNLRFSIYNDLTASGSALQWQEIDNVKPDANGVFSVLLGNGTTIPQSLFGGTANLYLGITVGQTTELTPRQQLATVAYATNAETLQGLQPITNAGGATSNVVLALDGTGNLTIGGSATPTFTATGGQFTLAGKTLTLSTVAGSNTNVQFAPDGTGIIDAQKPIQNTTKNNNIASAVGAVEIDDLFAILATSSGQSAATINQNGSGPIISASASGSERFTVSNTGTIKATGYTTGGGILFTDTTGLILQTAAGTSGQCLTSSGGSIPTWGTCGSSGSGTNFWTLTNGALFPVNTTLDVFFGGTATSSANFAFLNNASGTPTASIAGNLTLNSASGSIQSTNNQNLTIGGNTTGGITLSPNNGSGTVTVNGSGLQTTASTFNLLTTTATTVNVAQAATALNFGATGGTTTFASSAINDNQATVNLLSSPTTINFGAGATTGLNLGASSGTTTIQGAGNINGNVILGTNATNTITSNGLFNTDLIPTGNGTINLGSSTHYYNTVYANNFVAPITGGTAGFWSLTNNVVFPTQTFFDLAIGGTATGAATPWQVFSTTVGVNTAGTATSSGGLTFRNANGTNIALLNNSSLNIQQSVGGNSGLSSVLYIQPATGNIGVGTTNPSSFKVQVAGSVGPNTTDTYDLGSASLEWNNLYVKNIISSGSISGFWQRNLGVLSPTNISDDLAVGGVSTSSALFQVFGNTGNATTAGSLTFRNGGSQIQTTSNQPLTLGGNSTGNIILSPNNGNGSVTVNGSGLQTTATTFNLLTTNATNLNIGVTGGTTTVNSALTITGTITPNGKFGASLVPSSTAINLGSPSNYFGSAYITNLFTSASSQYMGFWQLNSGVLSPTNSTNDLAIGGTATAGAKFQVFSNSGNATTAGSLTFNSGAQASNLIAARNNQGLTIGDSQTGNIIFNGGNVTINGLGTGVVHATGGLLSSGNVSLTSEVSGILPIANGGTNTNSLGSAGTIAYSNGSAYAFSAVGTSGQCLVSGGSSTPTWESCSSAANNNYWTLNNGTLYPINSSLDVFFGGTATSSANFAFINNASGTPTASIAGNLTLNSAGLIQTTKNQPLTLGGNSTGNIILSPNNGNGSVTVNGTFNSNLLPTTTDTFNLGSATQEWNNLYVNNIVSSGGVAGFWQRILGLLSPSNITDDLAIGGSSTVSAKFQIFSATGNATTTGNLTFASNGTIQTTGMLPLTIGSGSTGSIQLSPKGTTGLFVNGNGSVGIGTTNPSSFALQVAGSVGPNTTDTYDLGSANLEWNNLYVKNIISSGSISGFWQRNLGALSPTNITDDLLAGGTGTNSAKFAVTNMTGSGTPTASVSSGVNGTGMYFDANGNIQTVREGTLTLGGSTTGNISLASHVSSSILPYTTNTYDLGSLALQWNNIYANNIYQNGQALTQLWQRNLGVLSPLNITDDFAVGGTATSSALFQVFGNSGNATTAGSLTFNSGTQASNLIAARNNQGLTIGDSQTGNIIFNGGNVGIGTTNPVNRLSVVGAMDITGNINAGGTVQNRSNSNNSRYNFSNNGSIIDRNIADSNPALIIQQDNSGSTGDILDLKNNLSTVFDVAQQGFVGIGNTLPGNSMLVVNQPNSAGDIFTASSAGSTKFTVQHDGTIIATKYNTQAGVLYMADTAGTVAETAQGGANQCLISNGTGAPSWTNCITGNNAINWWAMSNGSLYPINSTLDVFFGGNSTSSANFAFINNASGTPTASIAGNLTLNSAGLIQTTKNQPLTLGGNSTGNIILSPNNGNGSVTVNGTFNSNLLPTTTDTFNLGSATQEWNSIFAKNIFASGNIAGFLQRNLGVLSPTNISDDLAIGGTATSSALFQVFGNSGNATTAGSLTFRNGGSQIQTTSNQPLTLGGNSTGNIILSPNNGNGSVTVNGSGLQTTATTFNLLTTNATTVNFAQAANALNLGATGGTTTFASATIDDNQATVALLGTPTTVNFAGAGTTVNIGAGSGTTTVKNALTVSGVLTANNNVILGASSANTINPVGQFSGSLVPSSTAINLGSPSNYFGSAYITNLFTSASSQYMGFWQLNSGVLSPTNSTNDLAIGGTATAGAKFQVFSNSGNATTAGSLTFNSGAQASNLIAARNNQGLTIGDSQTGNIIFNGGNVGIGTTNPSYPLDVNGTIRGSAFFDLQNISYFLDPAATGNSLLVAGTIGVGTTSPLVSSGLDIEKNALGNAALVVNQQGNGDIFTASSAGATKFTVQNDGTIIAKKYTTQAGLLYMADTTGTVAETAQGTTGQCLISNGTGAPSWAACATGAAGVNWWSMTSGALYPINTTLDFLIGGNATTSAKFAVTNMTGSGTPTASISSGLNGSATLISANGTIQTTNNQGLTIGGNTTGNITISPLNGGTGSKLNLNAATIETNQGTLNLFNNTPTTVNFAGAANTLNIGGIGGTTTFASATIDDNQATVALLPTPTTVNFAGAATTLNIGAVATTLNLGAATGTTTVKNALSVNGNVTLGTNNTNTITPNGLFNADIIPTGNGSINLGSGTHYYNTVYANNFVSPVGNGTAGFWTLNTSLLYPVNTYYDLGVGGNATGSAMPWQVFATTVGVNTAGTATSSGGLTFRNASGTQIALLNGSALNVKSSLGGDSGLSTILSIANNGDINQTGNFTSSGNVAVNGGTLSTNQTTAFLFNTTATTVNIAGGATTGVNLGHASGTTLLRGNLTLGSSATNTISAVGEFATSLIPNANNAYDLGTRSLTWRNLYLSGNYGGLWQRFSGVVSPTNSTDDLAIGGSATSSALFQVFGNTGNATTSGNLTFNTNGLIQTTSMLPLTLGSASTGPIQLSPKGTTGLYVSGTGNVGIGTNNPLANLEVGNTGGTASPAYLFLNDYGNSANGAATIVGNWTSSNTWGIGAATNTSDNTLRIGNISGWSSSPTNTWSSTQNLSVLIGGNLGISALKNSGLDIEQNSLGNSALVVNNSGGSGDIFTASSSGTPKFTVASDGSIKNSLVPNLVGATGIDTLYNLGASTAEWDTLYVRQIVTPTTGGLAGYWQLSSGGVLAPANITNDLAVGGIATGSATPFQIFGTSYTNDAGTVPAGTATTSGNLIFRGTPGSQTGFKADLLNGSTIGFYPSVGGDLGLVTNPALYIANTGFVGIGTNNPQHLFQVGSNSNPNVSSAVKILATDASDARLGAAISDHGAFLGAGDGSTYGALYAYNYAGSAAENLALNQFGGNVGINTTNPTSQLTIVAASSSAVPAIDVKTTNGLIGDADFIRFNNRAYFGYDPLLGATVVQGASGKGIEFNTNNSAFTSGTVMFINSSGSVGIGTTSPQYPIDLVQASGNNGLALRTTATGNAPFLTWKTGDVSNNLYSMRLFGGSNPTFSLGTGDSSAGFNPQITILPNNGNVGIGTTSPVGLLDLEGNVAGKALAIFNEIGGDQNIITASASGSTEFTVGNTGIVTASSFYDLQNSSYFLDPAATGTSLAVAGSVGIGTTTPNSLLHIKTNSNASIGETIENDNSGANAYAQLQLVNNIGYQYNVGIAGSGTNACPQCYFVYDNNGGGWRFTINTGGNVGIDTATPHAGLEVATASAIFGAGEQGTPTTTTIRGAQASGTDVAGANLNINASNGTGKAGSGDIIFNTATNIGFDNADSFTNSASGSAKLYVLPFTVGSGSNRALIVTVGLGLATTGTTVHDIRYGTQAMTLAASTTNTNHQRVEIWSLVAPTTGTANINVTFSGNVPSGSTIYIGASSWTGIDQTTPVGTGNGNSGNTNFPTVTVSNGTPRGINIAMAASGGGTSGHLMPANRDTTILSSRFVSASEVTFFTNDWRYYDPSQTTFDWTYSETNPTAHNWAAVGVPLNPASSSTAETLAEAMRIDEFGHIGIATASPDLSSMLTVNNPKNSSYINIIGTAPGSENDGNSVQAFSGLKFSHSGTLNQWSMNYGSYGAEDFRICYDEGPSGADNGCKVRIGNTSGQIFAGSTTIGSNPDIAEPIAVSDASINQGDIISPDVTSSESAVKASTPYDPSVLGAVSQDPGMLVGAKVDSQLNVKSTGTQPLVLAGRIPLKVSTINGPIHIGDSITSSTLPGIGMKATQAGKIVARAYYNFNPDPATCQAVPDINSIQWSSDDWNDHSCYKLPDGTLVGKIVAAINPGWYDPQAYLTDTGNLTFADASPSADISVPHYFTLNDALGNPLTRVEELSQAAIANLRAGVISTQQLFTNSLAIATDKVTIAGQSLSDYIVSVVKHAINNGTLNGTLSPIASIDQLHTNLISPLASDSAIALDLSASKFTIRNSASGSAVASIDNAGNATFSGTINSQNLAVNTDATISGTLHAHKIVADDIEGLSAVVSTLSAQNITNVTNIYFATPSGTPTKGNIALGQSYGSSSTSGSLNPYLGYTNIASYSSFLAYVPSLSASTAVFDQGLDSLGSTVLSDTTITGQLSIGASLTLADNSINVLGQSLEIQPLRQGGVNFEGGLLAIDTDGNLTVNGNAVFGKTLAAHIISPLSNMDNLTLQLGQNSTASGAALATSNLSVQNASGSGIFAVDQLGNVIASGAANVNKLNFNLVQPALAVSDTEVIASGSAGTASIKAHQSEVTIDNPLVTDKSLIYITPVGQSGVTPYLIRQVKGTSFTVGISLPQNVITNFNWLIVN